jgi:hypothetical protein
MLVDMFLMLLGKSLFKGERTEAVRLSPDTITSDQLAGLFQLEGFVQGSTGGRLPLTQLSLAIEAL